MDAKEPIIFEKLVVDASPKAENEDCNSCVALIEAPAENVSNATEDLTLPKEIQDLDVSEEKNASERNEIPIYPRLEYTLNDKTEVYEITKNQTTIGRADDNDVIIQESKNLSRTHCQLLRYKSDWFLEDCGSFNGTFFEGYQLEKTEKMQLAKNGIIRLGEFELKFIFLPPKVKKESFQKQKIALFPKGGSWFSLSKSIGKWVSLSKKEKKRREPSSLVYSRLDYKKTSSPLILFSWLFALGLGLFWGGFLSQKLEFTASHQQNKDLTKRLGDVSQKLRTSNKKYVETKGYLDEYVKANKENKLVNKINKHEIKNLTAQADFYNNLYEQSKRKYQEFKIENRALKAENQSLKEKLAALINKKTEPATPKQETNPIPTKLAIPLDLIEEIKESNVVERPTLSSQERENLKDRIIETIEQYALASIDPNSIQTPLARLVSPADEAAALDILEIYRCSHELYEEMDHSLKTLQYRRKAMLRQARGGNGNGQSNKAKKSQRLLDVITKKIEIQMAHRTRLARSQDLVLATIPKLILPGASKVLTEHFKQEKDALVRYSILQALKKSKYTEAVPILIRQLSVRDKGLKKLIGETLAIITGVDFGTNRTQWNRWQKEQNKKKRGE